MRSTSVAFFNHSFYSKYPYSHSSSHLNTQQKKLLEHLIPASRITIPKNTQLVGLNKVYAKPYFLGTLPMYHPDILQKLSANEKRQWLHLEQEISASIGIYNLNKDLECLVTKSDNGVPMCFIDSQYLSVEKYLSIQENIGAAPEEDLIILRPYNK